MNRDVHLAEAAELAELRAQAAQQRAELGASVQALASRLRNGSARGYALDAVRLAGARLDRRRVLLTAGLPVAALVLVTAAVAVLSVRRPRTRR
ncbi:MAG TPA: hypothetical protein VIP48_11490 [Streptosporangiaceae bacterium]